MRSFKTTLALFAVLFPVLALATGAAAQSSGSSVNADAPKGNTFSDAQKSEIGDVIKDYLVNKHPEVLVEAMQQIQKRDQETAEVKSKQAVKDSYDKIYSDPASPVGGNPKGDVTIVEFFDYQCGYCKMSEDSIEKILKADKNVKFIYKNFPILGPLSTVASKAALASVNQNKYIPFHEALMSKKDHLTEDMLYQIAKDVGLDVDRLKKDAASDAVTKEIESTLKLGADIGVRGTPMFIIGDNVYPGALQLEQMKKAVDDARTAAKKP